MPPYLLLNHFCRYHTRCFSMSEIVNSLRFNVYKLNLG